MSCDLNGDLSFAKCCGNISPALRGDLYPA